jgi:hypothetical protein
VTAYLDKPTLEALGRVLAHHGWHVAPPTVPAYSQAGAFLHDALMALVDGGQVDPEDALHCAGAAQARIEATL